MHAYLIIGRNQETKKEAVDKLTKSLKVKTLEFPLQKIEDTRKLSEYTNLTLGEPTAILLDSVDTATTETLNAFLKNLEEPQGNLYFILTASSVHGILPTILSRCQIIKTSGTQEVNLDAAKFLKKGVGERLAYVDQIRKREEAIEFMNNFIAGGHSLLTNQDKKHTEISAALRAATDTLNALKANGNVALQLTNFVVRISWQAS